MELVTGLAQLFGGGPQAAFIAVLCVTCVTLYVQNQRGHARQMALAMRVVLIAERLTPLVEKAQRKTGTHKTVEAPNESEG